MSETELTTISWGVAVVLLHNQVNRKMSAAT